MNPVGFQPWSDLVYQDSNPTLEQNLGEDERQQVVLL